MRDVLMVAATVSFFALCFAYVSWCDHIIGPDPIDRTDGLGEHAGAVEVDEVPR